MTQTRFSRISLATALFSIVLGATAVVAAEPGAAPSSQATPHHCDGKEGAKTPAEREQRRAERFQKHDKNKDGFLTKEEVGEKRWERMKVADANADSKLSKAELDQAHKDGKLGHRRHRGGGDKARS